MDLKIKDTFSKALPADKLLSNERRQVVDACFSYVEPQKTSKPELLHVSDEMLESIGLNQEDAVSEEFLNVFTGNGILEATKPYAMCYGGHQFGHWAGQLGDGRAINLAEVMHEHQIWVLQLKGAGPTPYSRTADGLAVLRSSIREHLCSEAMFHLGVPTTRSLSLALTGDQVLRDVMYDGNPAYEKGAVVCRVAPSFIRFGNFQILAARKEHENLKQLLDYTIKHFYPQIEVEDDKAKYLEFFKQVSEATLEMLIHWQRVGFVHGVMNTDNMSILGLTIDYGPYGWLEGYDLNWTPNTTDRSNRRYRYGNQVGIGLWNLLQLANAIYPLVNESKGFEKILDAYKDSFSEKFLAMMCQKLGLKEAIKGDDGLVEGLQSVMQLTETDMTIFFRNLTDINKTHKVAGNPDFLEPISDAFYTTEELNGKVLHQWQHWMQQYVNRLGKEVQSNDDRKSMMNKVNPKYVLRNYMAQIAIDKANDGDYSVISELYELLKQPYSEQKDKEKWFTKRPDWARHKVGCSMLSCSS